MAERKVSSKREIADFGGSLRQTLLRFQRSRIVFSFDWILTCVTIRECEEKIKPNGDDQTTKDINKHLMKTH